MSRLFDNIINNKLYIIAEMSANHGGKLENALKLVKEAARIGVDCLKIQTYTADSMTIDSDEELFKIKGGLWDGYKLYDLYKEAATPYEWQKIIKDECKKYGIDFLSTPFDKSSVDFLESLDVEMYKIASFELVDIPLIEYIASKHKPIIMSCGMASIDEIKEAINACLKHNNKQIILLKCCSEYPTNWEDMHLGNIPDMKNRFGLPVGLSDHSLGSLGAIVGVTLGACVIEKHIKLSDVNSPDSDFSMSVDEFALMINNVNIAKQAAKGPIYELSKKEQSSLVFRRSIFAVKDIKEGDIFDMNNIKVIRPSYGLPPKYFYNLLGSKCVKNVKAGEPILFSNTQLVYPKEDVFLLRNVDNDDVDFLFDLANDPIVRANSFNSDFIKRDEHNSWFENMIKNPLEKQYIFTKNSEPIGQIRFSIQNDKAEIGYSIVCSQRGLGYGCVLLKMAINKIRSDYPNIKHIVARVKSNNVASKKCFIRCGFKENNLLFELGINE